MVQVCAVSAEGSNAVCKTNDCNIYTKTFADSHACSRRKFFVFICFVMLAESWCFIVHAVRYFGGVFFLIHPKTC